MKLEVGPAPAVSGRNMEHLGPNIQSERSAVVPCWFQKHFCAGRDGCIEKAGGYYTCP